jgi:hypothetical protein
LVPGAKQVTAKRGKHDTGASKTLVIFIDETDTWNNTPLYEAIVRRLRQLDVARATVHIGNGLRQSWESPSEALV